MPREVAFAKDEAVRGFQLRFMVLCQPRGPSRKQVRMKSPLFPGQHTSRLPVPEPRPSFHAAAPLAATAFVLLLLLLWDASGADMALARRAGTPFGFPLREEFWLTALMHRGGKALSWLIVLALLLAVRWPVGALRRLSRAQRLQLALAPLAAVALIALLKHHSSTSCPWDLQPFGGAAPWVSHWMPGVRDGGGGRCFPAGHASAAFCFLGGWFVWRPVSRRIATAWLLAALIGGLALGVGQQLRGAHFMSHTLWTGWLCWTAGFAIDVAVRFVRRRRVRVHADAKLNES